MMMMKNIAAFAAALLPLAAMASPAQEIPRQVPPEISCDTSDNSPFVTDAQEAMRLLFDNAATQTCTQKNSECTEMQTYGNARLSICGVQGMEVPCVEAVNHLEEVFDACTTSGRIGGSYQLGFGNGINRVQFERI